MERGANKFPNEKKNKEDKVNLELVYEKYLKLARLGRQNPEINKVTSRCVYFCFECLLFDSLWRVLVIPACLDKFYSPLPSLKSRRNQVDTKTNKQNYSLKFTQCFHTSSRFIHLFNYSSSLFSLSAQFIRDTLFSILQVNHFTFQIDSLKTISIYGHRPNFAHSHFQLFNSFNNKSFP